MQDDLDINVVISIFDEKEGLVPSFFTTGVSKTLAEEVAMSSLTHSFLGTTTSTGDLILPFPQVKKIAFVYYFHLSNLRPNVVVRAAITLLFPENIKNKLYDHRSELKQLIERYVRKIDIENVNTDIIGDLIKRGGEQLALIVPSFRLPRELSHFQQQLTSEQLQLLENKLKNISWKVMVTENVGPDFLEFSQALFTLAASNKLPQTPEILHLLLRTSILRGQFKHCQEISMKEISPEIQVLQAFCLFRSGKILEAIEIWENIRQSVDQLPLETRIQTLSFLSEAYLMRGEPALALDLAQKAFDLAKQEKSEKALPGYHALSYFYILNGKYGESAEIIQKALKIVEQVGDRYWKAWFLDKLALQTYHQGGGTHEANLLFYEALEYFKELDNHHAQAIVNFHIGDIWRIQGQFDLAYRQLTNSLRIIEECNDSITQAQILCNLGTLFLLRNTEKSLDYFKRAKILGEQMQDSYTIINSLLGIGTVLKYLQKFDAALEAFKAAQILSQKKFDRKNLIRTQIEIGELYLLLNEPLRAEGWIISAVSSLEMLNFEEEIAIRAHLLLARILSSTANFEEAFYHIDYADQIAIKLHSPEYKEKCQLEREATKQLQKETAS
ncbi:MAG: hypothetical protein ACFFBD_13030 [Candidatus Hodarchaeota archaeon]